MLAGWAVQWACVDRWDGTGGCNGIACVGCVCRMKVGRASVFAELLGLLALNIGVLEGDLCEQVLTRLLLFQFAVPWLLLRLLGLPLLPILLVLNGFPRIYTLKLLGKSRIVLLKLAIGGLLVTQERSERAYRILKPQHNIRFLLLHLHEDGELAG